MHHTYWHEKWINNDIAFHTEAVDTSLMKYFNHLQLQKGDTIFVPLCGKSQDLIWLTTQHVKVIGVELSDIACPDFFEENKLEYQVETLDNFKCYYTDKIKIFQGDYFCLTRDTLADVKAVYDRRALVALPPDMRKKYYEFLKDVLPHMFRILLITMVYPVGQLNGPPFSISETEVQELYVTQFKIQRLAAFDIKEREKMLMRRALVPEELHQLEERVYLLEKL